MQSTAGPWRTIKPLPGAPLRAASSLSPLSSSSTLAWMKSTRRSCLLGRASKISVSNTKAQYTRSKRRSAWYSAAWSSQRKSRRSHTRALEVMVGFSSVIICWLANASVLCNNGSQMLPRLKHSLNALPCLLCLSTRCRLNHRYDRPIESASIGQRQCGANPALLFECFATEGQ